MTHDFLTFDVPLLFPFLSSIYQNGGAKAYALKEQITPLKFIEGQSGFQYRSQEIQGELLVGLILGGTGFSLKRKRQRAGHSTERYDYFNLMGEHTFSSDKEALKCIVVDFSDMERTCPILNHFYNYLSLEYRNAAEGKSQTGLVHAVETILRDLYRSPKSLLPIKRGANDPAVEQVYMRILAAEMDPVLTWEERQTVFSQQKKELRKIVKTKLRAHQLNSLPMALGLGKKNFSNFFARLIARPLNNFKGLLNRYTIGKIIWFFQTVRNNLGYSIALAVYGPFTYYFITMPMNPHAMQAVGRVRATYLETKNNLARLIDASETVVNDLKAQEAIASSNGPQSPVIEDSVKSIAAKSLPPGSPQPNIIFPSLVTSSNTEVNLGPVKATPKHLNMLLTTDSDYLNKASWSERMSNFKQMQIAYEENIEFASRMGRLEQLETQYNFPMQVEAAWEELERYNSVIFKARQENPQLSAKMKQFLYNEINRTQQLELYLWDRMGRFILDQIYVMLDQDKEQKRNDYYVGRAFVFMEEMTNVLSWRYQNFKKPEGFERIQKLAQFYKANRKETGSVLRNLTANSDLYKQKNILDTKEFRSYMKRQWEILYLQNSKAEEASNMGLNMYIWSVRNTVWILQSLYSAKREELSLLLQRDSSGKMLTPEEMLSRSKLSMLYETLLHNLTLEYVGIREEIMNRLGKDIESKQRMTVLENIKEFLGDREKLDNLGMVAEKNNPGTKL